LKKNIITVSSHQPNFIPWLGFWNKLISTDIFVLSTGIQFVRRSFGNRVIMSDNNSWATIPVIFKFDSYDKILISDMNAVSQIGRRIMHWSNQKKYKYSDRLIPIIERFVKNDENNLCKLNIDLIKLILKQINHSSTKLIIDNTLWKDQNKKYMISSLVNKYGNTYMSGSSVKKYLSRKDINDINNVYVQKVDSHVGVETILHTIAFEENPIEYINKSATWNLW
jgi:hypothetical protein